MTVSKCYKTSEEKQKTESQKFTWVGNIVEIKTEWFGRVNLKNIGLFLSQFVYKSVIKIYGNHTCLLYGRDRYTKLSSASLKFEVHLVIDEKVQN